MGSERFGNVIQNQASFNGGMIDSYLSPTHGGSPVTNGQGPNAGFRMLGEFEFEI